MPSLRTGPNLLPIAAVLAVSVSGPAFSQPTPGSHLRRFDVAAVPEAPGPSRNPPLSFAVTDHVTVVFRGGKVKPAGEVSGRRVEGPAGRSASTKAVRMGVVLRW